MDKILRFGFNVTTCRQFSNDKSPNGRFSYEKNKNVRPEGVHIDNRFFGWIAIPKRKQYVDKVPILF